MRTATLQATITWTERHGYPLQGTAQVGVEDLDTFVMPVSGERTFADLVRRLDAELESRGWRRAGDLTVLGDTVPPTALAAFWVIRKMDGNAAASSG